MAASATIAARAASAPPASVAAPPPATSAATATASSGRQIPIVCPGHTRPLAELQFCTFVEAADDAPALTAEADGGHSSSQKQQRSRTLLASACHDKLPMLRDATSGDWIGTFAGHKGAVWSTRFDPTASLVTTASGDFTVKIWDAITGNELYNFVHDHVVKTVDWSLNSQYLATGGHEGIVRIFDVSHPEKEPRKFVIGSKEKKVSISKVNWYNDSIVLAAGEDGILRFINVNESEQTDHPTTKQQVVKTLQVSDDGCGIRDMELVTVSSTQQTILTIAAGQHVSFYDMATLQLLHSYAMPIHFREEGGASLHPISGSKFVVGGGRRGGSMASGSNEKSGGGGGSGGGGELGSDLMVYVFDYHTGEMLEKYKGHHGPIRCVRYHPDGKSYATGSEDGTIRLWQTDP
ncbi:hypothetical protein ACHAXH_008787 [Discostella pseudostelligera]